MNIFCIFFTFSIFYHVQPSLASQSTRLSVFQPIITLSIRQEILRNSQDQQPIHGTCRHFTFGIGFGGRRAEPDIQQYLYVIYDSKLKPKQYPTQLENLLNKIQHFFNFIFKRSRINFSLSTTKPNVKGNCGQVPDIGCCVLHRFLIIEAYIALLDQQCSLNPYS